MTRQETQILKGMAILMMLFLHLFNRESNVSLCHNFIYIGDTPLVLVLARASNPVSLFTLLGGYGLYKAYEKGEANRWSRLFNLMFHYWVITTVFLIIGYNLYPDRYPGSFSTILSNFTGFQTTYNGEMWFLLPYLILSALAKHIFDWIRNIKVSYVILGTLFIHLVTSYGISRYGQKIFFNNYWIYTPWLVLHLMFAFCLGAMCARNQFFENLKSLTKSPYLRYIPVLGAILLIVIECLFKYNYFYSLGLTICIIVGHVPKIISSFLELLGKHSMNIWMIHSWFCYYLFHDFIYSFTFPLIIFLMLILIRVC